jgi:hypothetical protein
VVQSSPPPGFAVTCGMGMFVYVTDSGIWDALA